MTQKDDTHQVLTRSLDNIEAFIKTLSVPQAVHIATHTADSVVQLSKMTELDPRNVTATAVLNSVIIGGLLRHIAPFTGSSHEACEAWGEFTARLVNEANSRCAGAFGPTLAATAAAPVPPSSRCIECGEPATTWKNVSAGVAAACATCAGGQS